MPTSPSEECRSKLPATSHRRQPGNWLAAFVSALLLLAGGGALFAQSTTGSLTGITVADEDGVALPGARITAVHQPTGARYSGVTGDDGRFRIPNVRVGGPYSVRVEMDGFHAQESGDVYVRLGEEVSLAFRLQLATVEETLTVIGESTPLINPGRTGAASHVSTEAIESLPTVERGFNDFARTNPFMTINSENQDPDAISVAGRNSRYNNITIDGSVNNDLFGLADTGTPGGQGGTVPISLDAIQELELVISDFDIRNGGFSGGSINAVTRSGSNDFKGSVFVFTRDDGFFGDGPDELGEFGDFEEDQYGFRLGGPISRDRVFFFANVDIEDRETPTGVSIDGSSGQAACFGRCVEAGNRFRQILIDNYGFDPGGLGENSRDNPSDKFFGRLDFNLSDSHDLTVRHNFVDAGRDVNRPSIFFYEFASETYDFQTETNSTVAQLNSVLSPSAFNEARIAFQTIEDRRAGRDGVRFPHVRVFDPLADGSGFDFEAGTEQFSTFNALDQEILELHNDFTLLKGDHTLVFGTHNELFNFENLFIQDGFGSYTFDDLDELESGIANGFDFTFVNPGQPPVQDFDVNQLGLYAGDQWAARDNLTLSFGLRVDIPFFPDEPDRNPVTEELFGFRTDDIPDGEELIQPRFGFNWDVLGDGRSQLRGGAGVFAGRTPYVWISNVFARNALVFTSIDASGAIPFNPDPDNQPRQIPGADVEVGEFNLIDPAFEFPQLVRYNLAYDYQLPWAGLVASAEVIFADSQEEIDYKDANLVRTGRTTFDGRPEYTNVDPGIDGAFLITNTSEGEATNFAVKLERPYRDGWWAYVSYAYNDAEVVNEGTSSRAVSNFNFQEAIDPNNVGVSTSDFEVRERINAAVSYQFNRQSLWPTTVSAFYNLQSGRPFSWINGSDFVTFGFGDSYNGDGSDGNDLAWVPATADDVLVTNGTWEELDAFISANAVLDRSRGGVVPRNADQSPWNHTLDLHIGQTIPVGYGNLEITFDILNLLNLIDEDSGVLKFANFNAVEPWEIEAICGETTFFDPEDNPCTPGVDDGKVALSLRSPVTEGDLFETHNVNSRWRGKLGVRWTF